MSKMSDVEDLESLSNAELRLKCIAFGLPNVPVTDSSRKLLLKRLRVAMTLKENPPKENPPKENPPKETSSKPSRRETINVLKTAADSASEAISQSQPPKGRRTIAATVNKDKDGADGAPTSIPISTRRRSVQKEAESSKPSRAAAKAQPAILIEDDEDGDLVTALENAEKESTSSAPIETISSRRKSRSVSVPKVDKDTTTLIKKLEAMATLAEEKVEQTKVTSNNNNAAAQKSYPSAIDHLTAATSFTQPTPKTPADLVGKWYGVYDQQKKIPSSQPMPKTSYENSSSRYTMSGTSSIYSSPPMRFSLGGASAGNSISSYRRKYSAADLVNEQSDNDNDGVARSPFLSNFARNLERSKSMGRSTGGGPSSSMPYKRYSGSGYETIRGRHQLENAVTVGQLMRSLDFQYKLKNTLIVLGLLLMSIFMFAYVRSS